MNTKGGVMVIKQRPNHHLYIQILRHMIPEQRLLKAFELSKLSRELFMSGLKKRFPDMTAAELKTLYLERLDKCHNRNY